VTGYPLLALSSFGLGALHAMEPGHGKTVVGAYLVGARGTTWHAVILGLTVTLTHTGIVIILGILSSVAAAYFVPETVQKVLGLVSGILVVGVGAFMIAVRIRQSRQAEHARDHAHDDHDARDHNHNDAGGHGHSHGPLPSLGEKPTLGQLLALGISGGIVPCPAALAVLLAAITFGDFIRAVSLVLIFSLGLACVLIAVGIIMVHAARLAGKLFAVGRWARIVPIASAVIITLLGVGLTIRAAIDL
jgi:nickel/cobalt transporter (NicO) family protein